MMDTRAALEREAQRFELAPDAFERQLRRRERKQRNRRVSAVALVIVLSALSITGLTRAFRNVERPATVPAPTPTDTSIFSGLGGWITYGGTDGIWAMDPNRPGVEEARVKLSEDLGEPLAWSSDGSKLLILGGGAFEPGSALSVLNADGSETLVFQADNHHLLLGASISPDGSTVIYAENPVGNARAGIFAIDATGGTPRLLRRSRAAPAFGPNTWWMLMAPTFSPDGTQIAYIEGMGDNTNSLRVMNADGSDPHALLDDQRVMGRAFNGPLVWSPDGGHLAFGMDYGPYSIYVVRSDGSGVTRAITGANPQWSPDSSRISYNSGDNGSMYDGPLMIADIDGTHVQRFDYGASGPWNPLDRVAS